MDPRIRWLQPRRAALWVGLLLVAFVIVAPLLVGLTLPAGRDPAGQCLEFVIGALLLCLTGCGALAMAPLLVALRRLAATRIGVCDQWVLVDQGNGVVRAALDEDLLRFPRGFIIEDALVATGTPRLQLYDRKELERWLRPRLERAAPQSVWQQTAWYWRHRRGASVAVVLLILVLPVLVIASETGQAQEAFERWLSSRPECAVLAAGRAADQP